MPVVMRAAALLVSWGLALGLQAQSYPSKPARIIVGFAAGGPIDIMARDVAQAFSASMGQNFVVDNRAGGNTVIAADAAARAAPDGYTLLVTAEFTMTVNPSAYAKLAYDPMRDFAPVSMLVGANYGIAANAAKLPGSYADMVAFAKGNPGKLSYGAASVLTQLVLEQLKSVQGIDMLHVPYKGSAEAVPALLAGQIDLAIGPAGAYAPLAKSGKARLLVVTGPKRDVLLPDVPTFRELGLPQLETISWVALFAPAGTPQDIVAKLNAEAAKALANPQVVARVGKIGFAPQPGTPEELGARVKSEIQRWAPLVKAAGIKFD